MAKNGFNNSFDAETIDLQVNLMKKDWIEYDIEYISESK
jgi:hypothetical protein